MYRLLLVCIYFFSFGILFSQEDTLSYTLYRDKIVVYSDIGFKAAPFNLKYDYPNGLKTLHYKHNLKPTMGIGVAYKWFALRIGFSLPGHLRSESKYGKSNYTDLGVKFNVKRSFWDIDVRIYKGYVIKDAYKWNDTLSASNPNDHRPSTQAASGSFNCWLFRSKDFNMKSVFGIAGDFKKTTGTMYFKWSLNFFGIGNGSTPIIPIELTDTLVTKTQAKEVSAVDFGLVPGYAYVRRDGNWQTSIFSGIGAVLQSRIFKYTDMETGSDALRGNLGLAPRVDFRFVSGYSKPNYFFFLLTDFDIKSISFQNMRYTQTFYSVSLCGGYRFNHRNKKEKK